MLRYGNYAVVVVVLLVGCARPSAYRFEMRQEPGLQGLEYFADREVERLLRGSVCFSQVCDSRSGCVWINLFAMDCDWVMPRDSFGNVADVVARLMPWIRMKYGDEKSCEVLVRSIDLERPGTRYSLADGRVVDELRRISMDQVSTIEILGNPVPRLRRMDQGVFLYTADGTRNGYYRLDTRGASLRELMGGAIEREKTKKLVLIPYNRQEDGQTFCFYRVEYRETLTDELIPAYSLVVELPDGRNGASVVTGDVLDGGWLSVDRATSGLPGPDPMSSRFSPTSSGQVISIDSNTGCATKSRLVWEAGRFHPLWFYTEESVDHPCALSKNFNPDVFFVPASTESCPLWNIDGTLMR